MCTVDGAPEWSGGSALECVTEAMRIKQEVRECWIDP